jgi:hypothetical protein
MGRSTKKFTYTDGSYFCNLCDSPHEGESLAEACFDDCETADLSVYGDVIGLTKLEVLIALEELLDEKGLRKEGMAKLREAAEQNSKIACELCTETTGEIIEIDGQFFCEPPCVEDDTITMHDESD